MNGEPCQGCADPRPEHTSTGCTACSCSRPYGNTPVTPSPGDFAVVSAGGLVGKLIRFGEWLNGTGFDQYEHALIYIGGGQIIQAEPGGVNRRQMKGHRLTLWSTGAIPLTEKQREAVVFAAYGYEQHDTDYSFLDYLALALHRLHIPFPGLRNYIKSTKHMICSQLVDQCYADAGVQLFNDDRWPGYVTPADLAVLIERDRDG